MKGTFRMHGLKSAALGLVAYVAIGCTSSISDSDNAGSPVGLWAWSAPTTSEATFLLSVKETEDRWLISVDGEVESEVPAGQAFSVDMPDGQRFEGRANSAYFSEPSNRSRSAVLGHWYQPSSSYGYSDMVTTVALPFSGSNTWKAPISIQARPFRVFLDVFVDDAGELAAVMRNPERNEIMRRPLFSVEQSAQNTWELVAGAGEYERRHSLKRSGNDLQLDHSWFDEPLRLQKINPADAIGYYPRQEDGEPARYTQPDQLDDGWAVASAEEAGFDRQALDALVQELAAADPRSGRPRLIHALLVAHKGKLIVEEYFHGYDRETTHDTRSLAKVFAPLLVGALQHQGYAISADDRPIPGVFAAAGETLDDPRKSAITLAHLMAFASGLDCDVNTDSPGNEDNMWSQQEETDFWLYTARLDLLHKPGERYAYCSGSINLVGSRLRAVGNKPVVELFDELIAKPLDFGPYQWNLMPNGEGYLGGGVYLRPRDVLKIGAVHAAGGVWKERRVLPAAWVNESTTPVIEITPETTGMTEEAFQNSYFGGAAAYEWRIDQIRSGDRTYSYYSATGNGGQIVLVVPRLELTALFMGGNYRQGGIWGRWPNEIIGGHVIPALMKPSEPVPGRR